MVYLGFFSEATISRLRSKLSTSVGWKVIPISTLELAAIIPSLKSKVKFF